MRNYLYYCSNFFFKIIWKMIIFQLQLMRDIKYWVLIEISFETVEWNISTIRYVIPIYHQIFLSFFSKYIFQNYMTWKSYNFIYVCNLVNIYKSIGFPKKLINLFLTILPISHFNTLLQIFSRWYIYKKNPK